MKAAAQAWFVIVAAAFTILLFQLNRGVELQTDMTALLPFEERDALVQRAKDQVTQVLTQRVFLMVGDPDREAARTAGARLADALADSGMTRTVIYHIRSDRFAALGKMYFPFRSGLLAPADRERLKASQGAKIVERAIAAVYGPSTVIDSNLLRHDPFLLMPEFMATLPVPTERLVPDDEVLSVRDRGENWVLIVAQLNGNVYSGAFQDRFISKLDRTEQELSSEMPHLHFLRVGAIFYAQAGAKSAIDETSRLGIVSIAGTIILILVVFHALRPLLLTLLAIAVGVLCAFAVAFSWFGGVHVAALLFGVSLIGIAIDYCLQYVSARFDPLARSPQDRLRNVLPGITLGVLTTLIGYATLMFAPFPGLHQIAVFSAVGLVASFATIVLWLPFVDSPDPLTHGRRMLAAANLLWVFWESSRSRGWRWVAIAFLGVAAIVGVTRLTIDDDVRDQQALSTALRDEESQIRRLTGISGSSEFLLVRAPNREAVLETEEALLPELTAAKQDGAIAGYQALAQFTPSAKRQLENRQLIKEKLLTPYLVSYRQRLGLPDLSDAYPSEGPVLMPDAIGEDSPLAFLRNLSLRSEASGTADLVLLNAVSRPTEIREIIGHFQGVRFVDPVEDMTSLLGQYRRRAMTLIAVSILLMLPVLIWRYGWSDSFRVMLAPLTALVAAPPLVALAGIRFTFFSAMALVLVVSIGFDYAVFCRETTSARRAVTMLGVWLAMATTLLSFGLLALSNTYAVRTFGATLVVGTILACVLSPTACRPRKQL